MLLRSFSLPSGDADRRPPPATAPTAKADAPKPEIITDEKAGVVRVLIAGREILRIDAAGLHVKGDLDYTGVMTDRGESKSP